MRALSIRQPWAWLICAGYKDVENREWATKFRGRIYVHAGKKFDVDGYHAILAVEPRLGHDTVNAMINHVGNYSRDIELGAIIGEIDIIDCVKQSISPWFKGAFGFVLANPVLYGTPIPCKGKLGFFEPDLKGRH